MIRISFMFFLVLLTLYACSSGNKDPQSPDGRIRLKVETTGDGALSYSIFKGGGLVIGSSSIEFEFLNQESFGRDLEIELISESSKDETWEPIWGKTSIVRDHYNEYIFRLRERKENARTLEWMIRIFNDGVAFRYNFFQDSGFGEFAITEEKTAFNLDPETKVWATNHGGYYSSQEHSYEERRVEEIAGEEVIGCPLLAEIGPSTWVAITEADLTDWAGLYFRRGGGEEGSLVSTLASLKRNPEVKVESATPASSPWRVIMIGDDPGDLIESNIIANLNDPVEYQDVEWIKPGLSAWDRWWSGDYGPDAGFDLKMNTATITYFVDLADKMDWEYMIVDWTWYGTVFDEKGGFNPLVDITTPIEEVDIEGIISYAKEKNVKIILWVLSAHLDAQMDEALAQYEKWGVAGIKVDFMDSDDQDMVKWYHKLARKAANHHLVIDFHGAYKPTGVSRTLPNLITREGVLGNEYNKWSDQITPRHTVVLPYTRGLLGEMDFTPGGFHHIHEKDFEIVGASAPNPYVMGTRCHQLAMLVVYESAFGVMCDSPYNYKDQPGTDFLRLVPTTWDETKYLSGYPGESIVMARRSGDQWFVGGMTGEGSRDVDLSFDFLESRIYRSTLWKDATDSDKNPAHLDKQSMEVKAGEVFKIEMKKAGGFVLILEPITPS